MAKYANEGIDTVNTAISYALGANIENSQCDDGKWSQR